MTRTSKVLVMGGLGFIGSHICRSLIENNFAVRVFDKLYASTDLVNDCLNNLEILQGDIQKSGDVISALKDVDIVIDLIHTTVPGSSMKDVGYDIQSNVEAHARWLSRINEVSITRIIYISSGGTVYGPPKYLPVDEQHPTDPISSYGITKLAVEKYVAMYAGMNGVSYCICRPSNVYGEGQRLNIGQGVIGVFLDRAMREEPIEIWGDGEVTRDYLHISDLTSAVLGLIDYSGEKTHFNVSSSMGYSLNEICRTIEAVMGRPLLLSYRQTRSFDVRVNILDSRRLREEIDWRPKTELYEGIMKMYEYLRAKPAENRY